MTRRLAPDLSIRDRDLIVEALAVTQAMYLRLHQDTGCAECAADADRLADLMMSMSSTFSGARAAAIVAETLVEAVTRPHRQMMKEADFEPIPF